MFCQLEKIELKVETCPARSCMYKGHAGSCNYSLLTKDDVTTRDIAAARHTKFYKVQAMASTAKQAITVGTTLMAYANYIKDSFPNKSVSANQTVNKQDDVKVSGNVPRDSTHVNKVLSSVFGLTHQQQQYFWDEDRFSGWAKRKGISLTLPEVRTALISASTS